MYLYKYRSDNEYTELSLINKKSWLATAKELNDPFECSIRKIDKATLQKVISEQQQLQVAGFLIQLKRSLESGKPFFTLIGREAKRFQKKLEKAGKLQKAHKIANNYLKSIGYSGFTDITKNLKKIDNKLHAAGIYSLSEVCDDAKMWAQYAYNHTGLCFGFDVARGSKLKDPKHCAKVIYSSEISQLNPRKMIASLTMKLSSTGIESDIELTFDDPNIKKAITTKSLVWESEKEWRYIEPVGGEYDFPAPLEKVIFGFHMSQDRRLFYYNLIKAHFGRKVKYSQATRKPNTNDFQIVKWQP